MSNRELARQLIAEISEYEVLAQFRVEGDKLFITSEATSNLAACIREDRPDLAARIRAHKADLIDYLTVPPETVGICRGGHKINWRCTRHGLWVCSCYFGSVPVEPEVKPAKKPVSQLRDYWQKAI